MMIWSFLIFLTYTLITILVFKTIPSSFSDTFYLWESKKRNLGYIFTIVMFMMGILLIAPWLNIASLLMIEGALFHNWLLEFLPFIAICGIMLVGAAPLFKSYQEKVHTTGALIAAVPSIIWMIVANYWWWILICLIICLTLALITRSIKSSYVFWLEMILFFGIFILLILLKYIIL